ncbi:MAG: biopolymer transporter ExbD [Planctomycetes bacterium]|nr:biopolymer transporter ExbD [Planctomycetota bacterium]
MHIADDRDDDSIQINVMPLIDLVIVLLIFFVVSTTFNKNEQRIKVALPVASGGTALSAPPKQLVINILPDGTVNIGSNHYNADELAAYIRATLAAEPTREVFIRADQESRHKSFAAVVRLCRDAGASNLKIGYIVQETAR